MSRSLFRNNNELQKSQSIEVSRRKATVLKHNSAANSTNKKSKCIYLSHIKIPSVAIVKPDIHENQLVWNYRKREPADNCGFHVQHCVFSSVSCFSSNINHLFSECPPKYWFSIMIHCTRFCTVMLIQLSSTHQERKHRVFFTDMSYLFFDNVM